MQKGMLQNSPPEFLIRGATHSIGCSHSPGHLRVSSYRDTAKLGVMGQRWCLPAHADRRTEILAAPGAVRIRDVASSPDLSHACTMLKRQGLHLRPLPKRRRTVVRQTSAAHRGQLAPSVAAWLAASGSARETFALEHFALERKNTGTSPLSSLHFRARGGGLQLLAGLRVRLVTDATIALLTRRFRGETSAWTCLRTEGAAALAI